jgi:diguanylate cyclase (GGDEF)-like protein
MRSMSHEPLRSPELEERNATVPGRLVGAMEQLATVAATALRVPLLFIALPGSPSERAVIVGGTGEIPRWSSADEAALWRSGLVELLSAGPFEMRDLTRNYPPEQLRIFAQLRLGSLMGAPIRATSEHVYGVIGAAYATPVTWNADDREMLQQFAVLAASDLELRRRMEELEANEERFAYHATHDALTGLATRAVLLERLREALERSPLPELERASIADGVLAPPAENLVAVIALDLESAAAVHARFGRQVGDQVLLTMAGRLRRAAGREALVARLGEERFGVLVEGLETGEAAERLSERLKLALEQPVQVGNESLALRVRVGVSLSATTARLAEHLMHRADVAIARPEPAPPVAEEPSETPVETSVETPVETSVGTSLEAPAEAPVETPVETPSGAEVSVERPSAPSPPSPDEPMMDAPAEHAATTASVIAVRARPSGAPRHRRVRPPSPFSFFPELWHAVTCAIRNASEYTKLDRGEPRLRYADAPVAPLLDEIRRRHEARAYARGLHFQCASCPADVHVGADLYRVRRVLDHLIDNAIKFTGPGGQVSVECDVNDQAVRLRVRDTGRGIPATWLTQVFEPYVQVDAHRTPVWRRGLGLGLTISQRWAASMGGALEVESEPDVGSTFTLTLLRG